MSEISRAKRIQPPPDPLKRRPEERRRRDRGKGSSADDESPFEGLEDRAEITEPAEDASDEAPPRERERREDEDDDSSIDVVA